MIVGVCLSVCLCTGYQILTKLSGKVDVWPRNKWLNFETGANWDFLIFSKLRDRAFFRHFSTLAQV